MELHDQTDPTWLFRADESMLGTGILIVRDQAGGADATRKDTIATVTYTQCVEQGLGAIAFKWVPHDVLPPEQARSLAAYACGEPCVDTCVRPACVCVKGFCR
jgi:hypothetical protein